MNHDYDKMWLAHAESSAKYPKTRANAFMGFVVSAMVAFLCIAGGLATLSAWSDTLGQALPTDEPGLSGTRGIVISLVLLGVGLLLVFAALGQRGELRKVARCAAAMRTALVPYGAKVANGRDVANWLVTYWKSEYSYFSLAFTPDLLRSTLLMEGYPCLIDVAPFSFKTRGSSEGASTYEWWSRVALAAQAPADSAPVEADDPVFEPLRARGYQVKYVLGGFVASADDEVKEVIYEEPERVIELLDVAKDLARAAKKLGCAPPC